MCAQPEGSFVDGCNVIRGLRVGSEIRHSDHASTTQSVVKVVWVPDELLCEQPGCDVLERLPSHCEVATSQDFSQLLAAKVFDDRRMDDAVWKFRDFETPSLSYDDNAAPLTTVGGWVLRRDDRLAQLIDQGMFAPGDELVGPGDARGVITGAYGIAVGGIRCDGPEEAAEMAGARPGTDGWDFWTMDGSTLAEIPGR